MKENSSLVGEGEQGKEISWKHPKMNGKESISKIHFCLNLLTQSLNVESNSFESSSCEGEKKDEQGMCERILWCRINFETFLSVFSCFYLE